MVEFLTQGEEAAVALTEKIRRIFREEYQCNLIAGSINPGDGKDERREERSLYLCPFGPTELKVTPVEKGQFLVELTVT